MAEVLDKIESAVFESFGPTPTVDDAGKKITKPTTEGLDPIESKVFESFQAPAPTPQGPSILDRIKGVMGGLVSQPAPGQTVAPDMPVEAGIGQMPTVAPPPTPDVRQTVVQQAKQDALGTSAAPVQTPPQIQGPVADVLRSLRPEMMRPPEGTPASVAPYPGAEYLPPESLPQPPTPPRLRPQQYRGLGVAGETSLTPQMRPSIGATPPGGPPLPPLTPADVATAGIQREAQEGVTPVVRGDLASMRQEADALRAEQATLSQEWKALQAERPTLDRTSANAVRSYNTRQDALKARQDAIILRGDALFAREKALNSQVRKPTGKEEYIDFVNPDDRGVRELERFGHAAVAGAIGTAQTAARFADYYFGSPAAQQLANDLATLRAKFSPDDPNALQMIADGVGSTVMFFIPGMAIGAGAQAVNVAARTLASRVVTMAINAGKIPEGLAIGGRIVAGGKSVASWTAATSSAFMEAMSEAGGVFEESLQKGSSRAEAEKAANRTFWANPAVITITNKLGLFSETGRKSWRMVKDAFFEGVQEAAQEITSSTAQGERPDPKQIAQAFGIGAVSAGGISGLRQQGRNLQAATLRAGRVGRETAPTPGPQPAAGLQEEGPIPQPASTVTPPAALAPEPPPQAPPTAPTGGTIEVPFNLPNKNEFSRFVKLKDGRTLELKGEGNNTWWRDLSETSEKGKRFQLVDSSLRQDIEGASQWPTAPPVQPEVPPARVVAPPVETPKPAPVVPQAPPSTTGLGEIGGAAEAIAENYYVALFNRASKGDKGLLKEAIPEQVVFHATKNGIVTSPSDAKEIATRANTLVDRRDRGEITNQQMQEELKKLSGAPQAPAVQAPVATPEPPPAAPSVPANLSTPPAPVATPPSEGLFGSGDILSDGMNRYKVLQEVGGQLQVEIQNGRRKGQTETITPYEGLVKVAEAPPPGVQPLSGDATVAPGQPGETVVTGGKGSAREIWDLEADLVRQGKIEEADIPRLRRDFAARLNREMAGASDAEKQAAHENEYKKFLRDYTSTEGKVTSKGPKIDLTPDEQAVFDSMGGEVQEPVPTDLAAEAKAGKIDRPWPGVVPATGTPETTARVPVKEGEVDLTEAEKEHATKPGILESIRTKKPVAPAPKEGPKGQLALIPPTAKDAKALEKSINKTISQLDAEISADAYQVPELSDLVETAKEQLGHAEHYLNSLPTAAFTERRHLKQVVSILRSSIADFELAASLNPSDKRFNEAVVRANRRDQLRSDLFKIRERVEEPPTPYRHTPETIRGVLNGMKEHIDRIGGAVPPLNEVVKNWDYVESHRDQKNFEAVTLSDMIQDMAMNTGPFAKKPPRAADILPSQQTPLQGETEVGKTFDGKTIYADANGARFLKTDHGNLYQSVRIIQTRTGVKREPIGPEELVKRGDKTFVTPEETAQFVTPAESPLTTPQKESTVTEEATRGERPGATEPKVPESKQPRSVRAPDADVLEEPPAPGVQKSPREGAGPRDVSESPGRGAQTGVSDEGETPARGDRGDSSGEVLPPQRTRKERPETPTPVASDVEPKPHHTSQPSDRPGRDYIITADDKIGTGTEKERFDANVKAVELLKEIEAAGRLATPEEQAVLVRYVGWGAMSKVFDTNLDPDHWMKSNREKNKTDAARYDKVKALFTPEEWEAASRSTQNAHYTSEAIVRGIWDALEHLGVRRLAPKLRLVEPAVGVGHFFGLQPEDLAARSIRTGVELDPLTGRIARQLYQGADIQIKGFQEVIMPDNFYHVFASNVPFARVGVYDPEYKREPLKTASLHNYYFFKALDKTAPGGVIAMITSRYTMDGQGEASLRIREMLAKQADLIGAIRLPYTAFKGNAGTEVVTDIIFLRKRGPYDEPTGPAWGQVQDVLGPNGEPLQVGETYARKPMRVNEYYVAHPEMVLGVHADTGTMQQKGQYNVEPLKEPLNVSLAQAITKLPKDILGPIKAKEMVARETVLSPDAMIEGSYTVQDGKLWKKKGVNLERMDVPSTVMPRLKGILGLRDAWREMLLTQLDPTADDNAVAASQINLNKVYDAFVAGYGVLHSDANLRTALRDDPEFFNLLGLENYDPFNKTTSKSDMFFKRSIPAKRPIQSAATARDALFASLNESTRVDLSRMQELTGKSEAELLNELGDAVFHNPEGEWETSDIYLSGNVRQKLAAAEAAAKSDPGYERNVTALKKVIPKDVPPSEIGLRLGSPWVPDQYVQEFIADLIGVDPGDVKLEHNLLLASWKVESPRGERTAKNTQEFGTQDFDALTLIEKSLNLRDVTVKRTDKTDMGSITYTDKQATFNAREKISKIKQAFIDWAWKDSDRAQHLGRIYNDEMNSHVPWVVDGSHLELQGANPNIALWKHQKDWIWRGLRGGNFLLAGMPGTGKTLAIAGVVMEMRRIGLRNKAIVVVQNETIDQFAGQWKNLYPAARLLVGTPNSLSPEHRREFLGRIATGDWDAVLITQTQMTKIPMSDEAQKAYLTEQMQELDDAILAAEAKERSDARATGERKRKSVTVKQLEAARDRLAAKLQKIMDAPNRDPGLTFEHLGVDFLVADEAHAYKNLFFVTKLERVAGLPTSSDTARSVDMYLKIKHVQKMNNGKGVMLATGTPLTNSIAEIYNLQRYLQPELLKELGLEHFDAWAQNFGEVVTKFEYGATGKVEAKSRFGEFNNIPELSANLRQSMEYMTSDEAAKLAGFPLPEVEYITIESPAYPEHDAFVKSLDDRAEAVKRRTGPPQPGDDNILVINIDGKKAAMDMRLVDPDAVENPQGKLVKVSEAIYKEWKDGKKDKLTVAVFIDFSVPTAQSAKAKAKEGGPKWPKFKVGDYVTWEATPETLFKGRVVQDPQGWYLETEDGRKVVSKSDATTIRTVNGEIFETAPKKRANAAKAGWDFYTALREKLLKMGIPKSEIAFIQEYKKKDRPAILQKVNNGEIRVIMGSRQIIGIGVNMQQRMVAGIQVDPPYRPDQLVQSNDRLHRTGNMNKKVRIYNFVQKKSYDAKLWQLLESKAHFTDQLLKNPQIRRIEDIGPVSLNWAQIKAIATDNPDLERRVFLDAEIDKFQNLRWQWETDTSRARQDTRSIPKDIADVRSKLERAKKITADLATQPTTFLLKTAGGEEITKREDGGQKLLDAAQMAWGKDVSFAFTYKGLEVKIKGRAGGEAYGYIKTSLGEDHFRLYESAWKYVEITEGKNKGKTEGKAFFQLITPQGVMASVDSVIADLRGRPDFYTRNISKLEKDLESAHKIADKSFEYADKLKAYRTERDALLTKLGETSAVQPNTDDLIGVEEGEDTGETTTIDEDETDVGDTDEPEPPTVTLGSGLGSLQSIFERGRRQAPHRSPDPRVEAVLSGKARRGALGRMAETVAGYADVYAQEFVFGWAVRKWPQLRNDFRLIKDAHLDARRMATEELVPILKDMNLPEFDTFSRLVYIRDLAESARRGETLPSPDPLHGMEPLTQDEVEAEKSRLEMVATPAVEEAIARHDALMKEHAEELVFRGELREDQARENYMPHHVLDYTDRIEIPGLPRKLSKQWRSYTQKRSGSDRLIDMDYLKVMWTHLNKYHLHNLVDDFSLEKLQEFDATDTIREAIQSRLEEQNHPQAEMEASQWRPKPGERQQVGNQVYEGVQFQRGAPFHWSGTVDGDFIQRQVVEAVNAGGRVGDVLIEAPNALGNMAPVADQIGRGLVRGRNYKVYMVPVEVAQAMRQFREPNHVNMLVQSARAAQNVWKRVTLGAAGLPYEYANFLGDLENIMYEDSRVGALPFFSMVGGAIGGMALSPALGMFGAGAVGMASGVTGAVLSNRHMRRAFMAASRRAFEKTIRDPQVKRWLDEAEKHRVSQSGIYGSDVAALLRQHPELRRFLPAMQRAWQSRANPINLLQTLEEIRESVPRLAKFFADMERIDQGQPVRASGVKMEGLTPISAAGKVAREGPGDYGAVTQRYNNLFRGGLTPFSTWYHKMYWKFYERARNRPTAMAFKILMPLFAMWLWNNTKGKEQEERLPMWFRVMPHINTMYQTEDGKDVIVTFQSSAAAVFRFVGLDLAPHLAGKVYRGEKDYQDAAVELAKHMGMAPVKETVRMLSPIVKTLVEATTGRTTDIPSKRVVPKSLEGSDEGAERAWQRVAENFLSPYAQFLRTDRSDQLPEVKDPILRTILLGFADVPRATGYRVYDPQRAKDIEAYSRREEWTAEYAEAIERGRFDRMTELLKEAQDLGMRPSKRQVEDSLRSRLMFHRQEQMRKLQLGRD